MNSHIDNDHIFLALSKSDLIYKTLEKFAQCNNIRNGGINVIEILEDPDIGCSSETKSYHYKIFSGDYDVTLLIDNITLKEEKYFSHTNLTLSNSKYKVFGGYLFDAEITDEGKFLLIPESKDINNKINTDLGLSLWCLGNSFD